MNLLQAAIRFNLIFNTRSLLQVSIFHMQCVLCICWKILLFCCFLACSIACTVISVYLLKGLFIFISKKHFLIFLIFKFTTPLQKSSDFLLVEPIQSLANFVWFHAFHEYQTDPPSLLNSLSPHTVKKRY